METQLQERFSKLPKVVQDAITSAEIEKHLRELADGHKLHLDQWELLENEVMLSLLGFQPTADLAANIQKHVGVDEETATALASDISTIVFEPVRQELERELEHPAAVAEKKTDVETMRDEMLKKEPPAAPEAAAAPLPSPSVAPAPAASTPIAAIVAATPPQPTPSVTVVRTEAHPNYAPSVPSHERKGIEGDPYREPAV